MIRKYFSHNTLTNTNEQNLIADLVRETIQISGMDVVFIIHHPRRYYKEQWDKKNHAEIEKQLDFFLRNNIGIDVTIIEMETQCVNEIAETVA